MTIVTAIKKSIIADIGFLIETASQYAPMRRIAPIIPRMIFPFGGFSPKLSLFSSEAVFEKRI